MKMVRSVKHSLYSFFELNGYGLLVLVFLTSDNQRVVLVGLIGLVAYIYFGFKAWFVWYEYGNGYIRRKFLWLTLNEVAVGSVNIFHYASGLGWKERVEFVDSKGKVLLWISRKHFKDEQIVELIEDVRLKNHIDLSKDFQNLLENIELGEKLGRIVAKFLLVLIVLGIVLIAMRLFY